MLQTLFVGLGGCLGSILRFWIGGYLQQSALGAKFPIGTLTVNLVGCFVIGFLSQIAEGRSVFTPEARAFLFIGVLGGFTTFSSFGNETVDLWRADKEIHAVVHVAAHFTACLAAVCLGRGLGYPLRA